VVNIISLHLTDYNIRQEQEGNLNVINVCFTPSR